MWRVVLIVLSATAVVGGCGRGASEAVARTPGASMPSEALPHAATLSASTSPSAMSTPATSAKASVTSPFAAMRLPAPPTIQAIPPLPPARSGGLALGDAQAVVLSALPDSATFKQLVQTPQGWQLRVHADDAKAIGQLTQRLAIEGHFEVRPATTAASGADSGGEVTLDLLERGLK